MLLLQDLQVVRGVPLTEPTQKSAAVVRLETTGQQKKLFHFFSFFLFFNNCIVPLQFLPWEIWVALPEKASCDGIALPNLRCMLGVLVFP